MALPKSIPAAVISEDGLSAFLREIKKFPILGEKEEYQLAKDWVQNHNQNAAKKMVTSHLRLVAKIASGYRGYGLPLAELISEGTLGLMHAVKRFDPDKGVRLSTYAMWWIRASIQEYVLKSWSLVKISATNAQKKLFFNLRRLKGELNAYDDRELRPEDVKKIAHSLDVSEEEVRDMNQRLSGSDASLNAPVSSGDEDSKEWQDWLVDETANQEQKLLSHQEQNFKWDLLAQGMSSLNDREREIITKRHLSEPPVTLDALATAGGISKERVRQIEGRALEKLQATIKQNALDLGYDG